MALTFRYGAVLEGMKVHSRRVHFMTKPLIPLVCNGLYLQPHLKMMIDSLEEKEISEIGNLGIRCYRLSIPSYFTNPWSTNQKASAGVL